MRKKGVFQGLFCLCVFSLCMYFYLEKQNHLTYLRMTLPQVSAKIRNLKEEIAKYEYEIDQLENPVRLMQLANSPEFSHLVHPYSDRILTIKEGDALKKTPEKSWGKSPSLPITIGSGR